MLTLRNMLKSILKKQVKHWISGDAITNSESIILKLDLLVVSIKHFSKYCLICIALSINTLIAIRLSLIKIINNDSIVLSEQVVDVLENEASILSYMASYIIFYALFLYLWFIVGGFLLKEVSKNLAEQKRYYQVETKLFSSNSSREKFQLENKLREEKQI